MSKALKIKVQEAKYNAKKEKKAKRAAKQYQWHARTKEEEIEVKSTKKVTVTKLMLFEGGAKEKLGRVLFEGLKAIPEAPTPNEEGFQYQFLSNEEDDLEEDEDEGSNDHAIEISW